MLHWTIVLAWSVAIPLQAATLYVAPDGDDTQPGTREEPLKTISAAAEIAMPGDVVYVLEGVYRERVAPPRSGKPGKPITYRGEPGKRVFVKGSEVWEPDWKVHGQGVFSAKPEESLFNDRSPEYLDHHNPFKVILASTPWSRAGRKEEERGFGGDEDLVYTCGQLFVDGKPFREVPFRDELKARCWYYEPSDGDIFVHFGEKSPADCLVELTTRRRIFAPQERGLGHIVVEGFIFEHCGNQYPTNYWRIDEYAQKGAVGTEAGRNWTIRRNIVRYAKTCAIDAGAVDRHSAPETVRNNLIEQNYVIDNGSAGILSNGSQNLVIRDNVILRNNRLHFLGPKRWEQGGIKCHNLRDGLIEHNYVAENFDTYGIWLDNQFPDSRISRNVVYQNGRAGIFLEMSDYEFDMLLVDNNIVIGNKENAVYIHDASGATFVHNLLANTQDATGFGQAIYILQVRPRTRTYHHSFFNNLIIGNARNVDVNYPDARSGIQRFDHNIYGVDADDRAFVVNSMSDVPTPWTPEKFHRRVLADVGLNRPKGDMLLNEERVALTAWEWHRFWRHHEMVNDAHSKWDPASRVEYCPDEQILTVNLKIDPLHVGTRENCYVEHDFFGLGRPAGESGVPGPMRSLEKGSNQYRIWNGLPVDVGGLPPAKWSAGHGTQ